MQSAPDAAKELERCVNQLGFRGALINGHTHGHYLDEDRYEVFWERVADLNVPIYIHPTLAWQTPQNYQDHPELGAAIWGWAPETGTHILRLLFSGLFDRFPTLQIIAGHGGESLPYFLWRFDSRFKIFNFGKTLKKEPSAYIRENVAITTAGLCATPPLRCALEEIGEDRVLFSIDYPYESSKEAGDWLDNAGLASETLRKVASGNAKRLLHLK
jgi:2,3-dihydroxybenzoate decarboxylase